MKNLINPFFTKEGDGNDVLFLHGWGCDGSIFKSSCKLLDGFRLTFVDLWGFGNTPMPDEFKSGGNERGGLCRRRCGFYLPKRF